jgi:hypothetical protein
MTRIIEYKNAGDRHDHLRFFSVLKIWYWRYQNSQKPMLYYKCKREAPPIATLKKQKYKLKGD